MPVALSGMEQIHCGVRILMAHGVPELLVVLQYQIRERDAQAVYPVPAWAAEAAELLHRAL